MKVTEYTIIACLLGLVACKKLQSGISVVPADSLQLYSKVQQINEADTFQFDMHYINNVRGHKEEETIIGNFTGTSIDTLYLKPVWEITYTENGRIIKVRGKIVPDNENDNMFPCYYWDMFSSNPRIPTLKIDYNISPSLVLEGDLDENGTAEIGILDTWVSSNCRMYRIYTLRDNCWHYILPPLETSLNLRASGVELAEPTGFKNKIRVRYANMDTLFSSCSCASVKDTIVTATLSDIEKSEY